MIERGRLQEADTNLRGDELLWYATGDGLGSTLVVTDAGLLVIGIEPVVLPTMAVIRQHVAEVPVVKPPTQPTGTKQVMLNALLQARCGATIEVITAAISWQTHTAGGAMSGALGKKPGLVVTSAKEDGRGRVYGIGRST